MAFDDYDSVAAEKQWELLGAEVTYTDYLAVESTIQALIDKDVEVYPAGYESQAPERQTEISLLLADVPTPKSGETITHGSIVYELVDLVADDGVVIVFTARVQ